MVTSRIWFTAAQKAELWERWKNGQSAAAISRALERKNKTGVERIVVLHGGIGPAAPTRPPASALDLRRGRTPGGTDAAVSERRAPSTETVALGPRRLPSRVVPRNPSPTNGRRYVISGARHLGAIRFTYPDVKNDNRVAFVTAVSGMTPRDRHPPYSLLRTEPKETAKRNAVIRRPSRK